APRVVRYADSSSAWRRVRKNTVLQPRRGCEPMRLRCIAIADVKYGNAEGDEHVGDQSPMTSPPQQLRTHHGSAQSVCEHEQLLEPLGEFVAGDMIRVAAKGEVAPAIVW